MLIVTRSPKIYSVRKPIKRVLSCATANILSIRQRNATA